MAKVTVFRGGVDSPQSDENRTVDVVANTTLLASDSGKTYRFKRGTIIFSLPATAPGLVYTFYYAGNRGEGQLQVSPVAADGIAAAGSAIVNKDLIISSANIRKGDFVTVNSGVGATGATAWFVSVQRGVITKEA